MVLSITPWHHHKGLSYHLHRLFICKLGEQLVQDLFPSDVARTDKAFHLYGPIFHKFNFPSLAGYTDTHHDSVVAIRGQRMMELRVIELFQKRREFSKGTRFHLLNLLSVRSLRTVLNPGRLARAPSSIWVHVISIKLSQSGAPLGKGACLTLAFLR